MTLMEEMKSVVTKLNQLTSDILVQRCTKQTLMVQMLNGTDCPKLVESVGICESNEQKENSPPDISSTTNNSTTNPSPYSVRGGGYQKPSSLQRMCQSSLASTTEGVAAVDKLAHKMAISLSSGLKNMDQCPLVTRLMQESLMLKSRTEESINSLNDSMEEIKEIRKEQDGIKWDFLQE